MLADRRAAIEGLGMRLADGIALDAESGLPTLEVARRGASRFAAGEGRGGTGAGVLGRVPPWSTS
jgi:enoyl-CoA hydratase